MNFDISELGGRIAARRKELQLTQEALAQRLGVSPQAVSKWETGAGCPDIATLPVLSTVLDLSLDQLFGLGRGSTKTAAAGETNFPQEIKGVPLVAHFRNCACYSTLPVAEIAENLVRFQNGSSANLLNREIINKGDGKIFLMDDDKLPEDETEAEPRNRVESGESSFDSIDLELNSPVKVAILPAQGEKGGWKADGNFGFMSRLSIVQKDGCLLVHEEAGRRRGVSFFNFSDFFNSNGEKEKNRLEIYVPAAKLQILSGALNGVGKVRVGLDVQNLDLKVNGSVNVEAQNVLGGEFRLNGAGKHTFQMVERSKIVLAGAGSIQIGSFRDGKLRLDGAGNIRLDEAAGILTAKLGGVGNISVAGGRVEELELRLSGAGNFKGENLEVQNAEVSIPGVGHAVIGTILGESREKVSGLGRLEVLHRS